jgi:hypothetical protein
MREYDLIADWYATDRGRAAGVAEALAVAAMLPANSLIWTSDVATVCRSPRPS